MNELDLVRGIATDTPEPGVATARTARARLLDAIATAETGGRGRPADGMRRTRGGVGWRRLRRLLPVGVIAAVLTAAVAAPLILHAPAAVTQDPALTVPSGPGGDAEPSAVEVLTNAALAASRAPAPRFGPGRYWYVLERGVKLGTNLDRAGSRRSFFYRFPYRDELWWGADGSLAGRTVNGRAQFLNDTERAAWAAAGRPDLGVPSTQVLPRGRAWIGGIGWLPASYQELVELPTQPERLAAELTQRIRTHQPDSGWLAGAGTSGTKAAKPQPRRDDRTVQEAELFGTIGWLLGHYPPPPKLQAALYQVLTRLDGVKMLGGTTDLAGRRCVSVAIDLPWTPLGERSELLLDPASGRLLGSRVVQTRRVPGWRTPPGTVTIENAYLAMAVVDSPNARS
jgi:hypothetical protein